MLRKIIKIDEDKCNGCGNCVIGCHEGAITLQNGKAKLLRDDYCDGLGDCLPTCPTGAISFEEREALAYDDIAVKERLKRKLTLHINTDASNMACESHPSMLTHWPIQIKLVPQNAPFFDGADLLIAADCTAFSYANFHQEFIKDHITLIGCPKLDMVDYAEKLCNIILTNDIKSIKVVKMEVPCCGGIVRAVETAISNSKKMLHATIITITRDGKVK